MMHDCKTPPPDKFYVVSAEGLELTRTDRKTAEQDVEIFRIVGKTTWVTETRPVLTAYADACDTGLQT